MQTTEDIIKILPKGLVTIPKRWREELQLEERGFVRMRKEGKRLILEPVSVISYPLREYSKEEIRQFLKEDKISSSLKRKVKKLLK